MTVIYWGKLSLKSKYCSISSIENKTKKLLDLRQVTRLCPHKGTALSWCRVLLLAVRVWNQKAQSLCMLMQLTENALFTKRELPVIMGLGERANAVIVFFCGVF